VRPSRTANRKAEGFVFRISSHEQQRRTVETALENGSVPPNSLNLLVAPSTRRVRRFGVEARGRFTQYGESLE